MGVKIPTFATKVTLPFIAVLPYGAAGDKFGSHALLTVANWLWKIQHLHSTSVSYTCRDFTNRASK